MQNAPDFKIELFNAFSQPVIFLQDGKVAYANHAAAACGVDASMELAQVVLEENGSVKLRLGDLLAPATCSISPMKTGTVRISRPIRS